MLEEYSENHAQKWEREREMKEQKVRRWREKNDVKTKKEDEEVR